MSNDELRIAVEEELLYEPRIDNNREIAVGVDDGVVTLRGTVGSLRERFEANKAAKRVAGVKNVHDELKVKLLGGKSRDDAELRGAVLQALMLDGDVPASVDATAVNGAVTLSGTATHHFQSEEAVKTAAKVEGVTAVDNEIMLVPPPPTEQDLRDTITRALERTAKDEAERIAVETADGVVALRGTVHSWAERDAAVSAASRAPGVVRVDDYLVIDD
jgi:osmotically-inducible protein OsmY